MTEIGLQIIAFVTILIVINHGDKAKRAVGRAIGRRRWWRRRKEANPPAYTPVKASLSPSFFGTM